MRRGVLDNPRVARVQHAGLRRGGILLVIGGVIMKFESA